ncbi:MAG: DUF3137 domain-containing protein [Candidatus Delongbacteria bacterium]
MEAKLIKKATDMTHNGNIPITAAGNDTRSGEHEAFYILTPDFMEKLIYFDRKYMDKISFSFKRNKLFIAIDTRKDYFDLKAFKKVDQTIFNEYQEELKSIQELVKILNLNNTIFK